MSEDILATEPNKSLDNFSIKITSHDGIKDEFIKKEISSIFEVNKLATGDKAQNLLQALETADSVLKEIYLKNGQISLDKIGMEFGINDKKFNLDVPFGQGVFSKNFNEILQLYTNDLKPNFLTPQESKGYIGDKKDRFR